MAVWNASSISWVKIAVGLPFVISVLAMPSINYAANYSPEVTASIISEGNECWLIR
jgi:hypothetical protein